MVWPPSLSASTFYKYVHLWNEDLKRYNIKIQNTQSSYQIIGDNEIRLRRFFTILFLEVSGYSSKVFLTHEKNDFLKNRIKNLYEHNKEEISQLQISFYADLYYVSLQREIQGYKVELPDNFIGDYLPLCDFGRSVLSTHYSSLTEEELFEKVLDLGAEDFVASEEGFEIYSAPEHFVALRDALEQEMTLARAELAMIPQTTIALSDDQQQQLDQLIEKLEDDDDVTEVYTSVEVS